MNARPAILMLVVGAGALGFAAGWSVGEELTRALNGGKAPRAASPPAEAGRAGRQPPTAEQTAAHDHAAKLVDDARRVRRWTDDDAQRLRQILPQLAAVDREDIFRALLPAINRSEVKVETRGPPF